ncbi:MAG TPA: prepilin-type N-terminal cleavage/methylation domain-containing protein [Xanthomonadales bacterium]|nr:prepilin-type N-terminal cleavage/methylation domain-containing protein [Xanthomonadales bacterium]
MNISQASSLLRIKQQNGLTLIELLIALVLVLFLLGGVILIHLSGRATFIDTERLSRIQENVRFASDYVIRDIRNAGFRDETFLKAGHESQIREAYATLLTNDVVDTDGEGETLRIRYAGRGHCTQAFDEFRLVENEYSMDSTTGELVCKGRSIPQESSGSLLIGDEDWDDAVGLVGGLTDIEFQLICPPGVTDCGCDMRNNLDESCIGVRVAMQFEGMRAMDGTGDFDDRSVELTAAFRNVILERVNADVEEF